MEKTRTLTKQDIRLLQAGDRLVFDVVAGANKFRDSPAEAARYFQSFGLNHGETYTFSRKIPISKPGEGTILGWYIHVDEERGNPDVPSDFYAVTSDLEARLAERK